MQRSARIDIEGVLQHVRGIEKRNIFKDDRDRSILVDRFSKLLLKAKTDCLAWGLLSNHAPLLVRPTKTKLSELMRCLLTGYAVMFNLRHHRSGHFFQNRYESVVCEEDSYLLELVRYIHLNPVRAGLVKSMAKLDSYKWSGHAVVTERAVLPGQTVDEVLQMFDYNKNCAVRKYRNLVVDWIALGRRDELFGGGLKRYLKLSGSQDFEAYDERILGSGEFVEQLWKETGNVDLPAASPPLEEIFERVATVFGIDAAALHEGSKQKQIAETRGAVCYITIRKFGYNGAVLAKALGITRSGVVLAARRGETLYEELPRLRAIAFSNSTNLATSPRVPRVPQGPPSKGCEGIEAENGRELLIADAPNEFAVAVLNIMHNPETGRKLAHNARRLVVEGYTRESAAKVIDQWCQRFLTEMVSRQ